MNELHARLMALTAQAVLDEWEQLYCALREQQAAGELLDDVDDVIGALLNLRYHLRVEATVSSQ